MHKGCGFGIDLVLIKPSKLFRFNLKIGKNTIKTQTSTPITANFKRKWPYIFRPLTQLKPVTPLEIQKST